jgi:hypothetical protein
MGELYTASYKNSGIENIDHNERLHSVQNAQRPVPSKGSTQLGADGAL